MPLVSRTQFKVIGLEGQVLGLGLEACKSLKMGQGHDDCFFALKHARDLAENF